MFEAIKNFRDFSGRASRKEFWLFQLLTFIISVLFSLVGLIDKSNYSLIPSFLVSLLLFIVSLSVSIRRLHDIDKKGWWLFIILVPFIGAIILLYWYVKKGTPDSNRFGENPLMQDT